MSDSFQSNQSPPAVNWSWSEYVSFEIRLCSNDRDILEAWHATISPPRGWSIHEAVDDLYRSLLYTTNNQTAAPYYHLSVNKSVGSWGASGDVISVLLEVAVYSTRDVAVKLGSTGIEVLAKSLASPVLDALKERFRLRTTLGELQYASARPRDGALQQAQWRIASTFGTDPANLTVVEEQLVADAHGNETWHFVLEDQTWIYDVELESPTNRSSVRKYKRRS